MEDKKEYPVTGTVTISTEEYRDLITDKYEAENRKDYYMREGWKKDEEINKLRKQVEVLTAQVEKYKNFVKSHCTLNAEDSISLFVNLGE